MLFELYKLDFWDYLDVMTLQFASVYTVYTVYTVYLYVLQCNKSVKANIQVASLVGYWNNLILWPKEKLEHVT